MCEFVSGRGGEIRTPDILLPKQARYQAALHPDMSFDTRSERLTQGGTYVPLQKVFIKSRLL